MGKCKAVSGDLDLHRHSTSAIKIPADKKTIYSRTGLRDLRTRPRNCDFTKTNFQVVLFRLGMTIAVLNYLVCTLYHLIALNIVELSTECAKPYQKSTKIIVFSIAFFVLLLHGIERTFTAFCLLGA